MKIAIMQPYLFPYIGYFQLVSGVDRFIFYDDVNFIKGGWIARNRILVNGQPHFFSIPLSRASSFKKINQIEIDLKRYNRWREKLFRTLGQNYKKAPFFGQTLPIVEEVIDKRPATNLLSEIASFSIRRTSEYLEIKTQFEFSSLRYSETEGLEKSARLKHICHINNADTYCNPPGGIGLYSKEDFKRNGINLFSLKSKEIRYKQLSNKFVPWLSIIDIMMFNSLSEIKQMLDEYELL